jgi:EamA domain-containing membrane protein RarD
MDPLVSILWGVLVFNEVTRTGGWLVLATLGAAGVGYGVLRLARSPLLAEVKEELPPTVRVGRPAESV